MHSGLWFQGLSKGAGVLIGTISGIAFGRVLPSIIIVESFQAFNLIGFAVGGCVFTYIVMALFEPNTFTTKRYVLVNGAEKVAMISYTIVMIGIWLLF